MRCVSHPSQPQSAVTTKNMVRRLKRNHLRRDMDGSPLIPAFYHPTTTEPKTAADGLWPKGELVAFFTTAKATADLAMVGQPKASIQLTRIQLW